MTSSTFLQLDGFPSPLDALHIPMNRTDGTLKRRSVWESLLEDVGMIQRPDMTAVTNTSDAWMRQTHRLCNLNQGPSLLVESLSLRLWFIHLLCFTEQTSLSSSSSSFFFPLYTLELRKGKVLVWNLRITCRLRQQRDLLRILASR